MIFEHETDLFQVFVNEYIKPEHKVLILGVYTPEIHEILKFTCDPYFVCNTKINENVIVSNYRYLPFEERSFDIIINMSGYNNVFEYCVPSGLVLIDCEVLDGVSYYQCRGKMYTVLSC